MSILQTLLPCELKPACTHAITLPILAVWGPQGKKERKEGGKKEGDENWLVWDLWNRWGVLHVTEKLFVQSLFLVRRWITCHTNCERCWWWRQWSPTHVLWKVIQVEQTKYKICTLFSLKIHRINLNSWLLSESYKLRRPSHLHVSAHQRWHSGQFTLTDLSELSKTCVFVFLSGHAVWANPGCLFGDYCHICYQDRCLCSTGLQPVACRPCSAE